MSLFHLIFAPVFNSYLFIICKDIYNKNWFLLFNIFKLKMYSNNIANNPR